MNLNAITDKMLSIVKSIWASWSGREKSKKIQIIVIAAIVIIGSGLLVMALNRTSYAVLYTNLSSKDAGDILTKLTEMKIDAKPQGNDTIVVPADQVDLTRMELASEGYPKTSSNLDILQQGTGFGITEEDKAIYRRYQLQEDLQNSIKTFESIDDAKVSLFIPKESSFVIDNQDENATAAALITLKPGRELSTENVRAITELIQKSVSGLTKENVSVIDSDMNVLTIEDPSTELSQSSQTDMEQQLSDRLKKQIMALLQPIFGIGKVLSQVNVTLNFDESTIDTIKFEPMENASTGIISNIDKIREVTKNAATGTTATGTDGAAAATYPVVDTSDTIYEKNTEQINYEINTIKEHLVKAKGNINKLSVSVILDTKTTNGVDYVDNVKKLVATAVGVSQEYITVETLPFNGTQAIADELAAYEALTKKAAQAKQTQFMLMMFLGIFIFAIVLIIIFKLTRHKTNQEEFDEKFPSLRHKGKEINIEIDDLTNTRNEQIEMEKSEKAIIEKYVESNPELVVTIIRSWLAEDEG